MSESDQLCVGAFEGQLVVQTEERGKPCGVSAWRLCAVQRLLGLAQTRTLFPVCQRVRDPPTDQVRHNQLGEVSLQELRVDCVSSRAEAEDRKGVRTVEVQRDEVKVASLHGCVDLQENCRGVILFFRNSSIITQKLGLPSLKSNSLSQ